ARQDQSARKLVVGFSASLQKQKLMEGGYRRYDQRKRTDSFVFPG
ncbi:unnamed protein product, partial [Allacma fusca]